MKALPFLLGAVFAVGFPMLLGLTDTMVKFAVWGCVFGAVGGVTGAAVQDLLRKRED